MTEHHPLPLPPFLFWNGVPISADPDALNFSWVAILLRGFHTREQSGEVGLPRLTLTHLEPPMTCPAVPAPAPAGGPILPPMVGRLSSLRLVNAPSHWGSPSVGSVLFPDCSSWVATLDSRIRWYTLWLYGQTFALCRSKCPTAHVPCTLYSCPTSLV